MEFIREQTLHFITFLLPLYVNYTIDGNANSCELPYRLLSHWPFKRYWMTTFHQRTLFSFFITFALPPFFYKYSIFSDKSLIVPRLAFTTYFPDYLSIILNFSIKLQISDKLYPFFKLLFFLFLLVKLWIVCTTDLPTYSSTIVFVTLFLPLIVFANCFLS